MPLAKLAPLVAALGMVLPTQASAHDPGPDWTYPPACCRGDRVTGDCQKIPSGSVREDRQGFIVILQPGDHHAVTTIHRFTVPYGREIPSGDGNYHACLHPTEADMNCFFAPRGQI
jgi:hypothetical protein